MKTKQVVNNAKWIIICKVAKAILQLIIGMISARYLGPSNYGLINYANSIVAFALPIMKLGLDAVLVNELVQAPEREGEIMGTSLMLNVVSSIICIIGVSAGALFGVNYFSEQKGRTLRYNLKYCNDKRYMSVRSLLLTGNIVNKKFAYYKITHELDPFDEKTYEKNKKDFYAVVTNVKTGNAEYVKITKPVDQLEELRASSAMPFYSRIIHIGNNGYLDGAVADSIPIRKAMEMGYDRIVVVLTQPDGFRKPELTDKNYNKIVKKYKLKRK